MQYLCSRRQLDLEHTLVNGQAFRWRLDPDGSWACLLRRRGGGTPYVLLRLRQEQDRTFWATEPGDEADFARDYLRLDIDIETLCRSFALSDSTIEPAIGAFPGLRVLRQDPVECLFSFLCTSAAPLHRIRKSIDGLCRSYGTPYRSEAGLDYFAFPEIEALAVATVEDMKALGMGYRARYVQAAARQILALGGADYLLSLRQEPYAAAKAALVQLTGVGEKIADCVCLFSLDKDEAIPVDTHIRRIAERHYLQDAARSLTPAGYARIGDAIRARFGPMAGWAQQYLFFEDLFEKRAWGAYERQWSGNAEE
jgi:N-glycosylase/DNA lyase